MPKMYLFCSFYAEFNYLNFNLKHPRKKGRSLSISIEVEA